jgi:DNA-binding transcriptional MerR regulator
VPGSDLPDKLFFKIGEVAQIVGVRPHVLRYWESEFAALRPLKTRGSHRVYRRRDVELAVLLRRLLHEEGLTIVGAKRRLRESGQHRVSSPPDPSVTREVDARAELLALREELNGLLSGLRAVFDDRVPSEPVTHVHATVTSSVPNSVPVTALRRPPTA